MGRLGRLRRRRPRRAADERIVLGFAGSAPGDSTVLIGCTVDDPHIVVVDIWAEDGDPRWRGATWPHRPVVS